MTGQSRRSPWSRLWTGIAGALAGVALAYFLDPQQGRSRRVRTRDQVAGTLRHARTRATRFGHYMSSYSNGMYQRMIHMRSQPVPPNDPALANKVRSILFRDPKIPKGDINIAAEEGIVVLRGEVEMPGQIDLILRRVHRIPGVHGVKNLLHTPMTEAANKVASRHVTVAK